MTLVEHAQSAVEAVAQGTSIETIPLGELYAKNLPSLDPRTAPDETFDLYSVPSHANGKPDSVVGSSIGSNKVCVEPGDVLLCRIVPHIRRTWVIPATGNERQIASGEWMVFRDRRFDARYLAHYLVSDVFHSQFMRTVAGVGGSLMRARPGHAASIQIPRPPLAEQHRIADILDRADELRAKRCHSLELLDELADAIFFDLFGPTSPKRSAWPTGTVRDLLASANYGTSGKAGALGKYPVLRMGNLTRAGRIDTADMKFIDLPESSAEKYLVRTGDVLFNRTNSVELVGKTAVVKLKDPVAFAGYLVRLRLKDPISADYLGAFLNSAYAKRTLRSMAKSIVGMANINAQEVQNMKIPLPPAALQREFSLRVREVDEVRESVERAIGDLDELFTSLQHRAFSGTLYENVGDETI